MRKDAFYNVHPAVELAFFAAVMLITAFVLHPVITGVSLVSACVYAVFLKGRRAVKYMLCGLLPFMLAVAVINPLFNHAGVRVLFYLRNGNAVTLEAVLYGIVSGAVFAALIVWFYCLNTVLTSDKYIYLFGRIIPALSLVFSMALRFVPRFTQRLGLVSAAQKSLETDFGKNPVKGVKHGLAVVSITTTWALESAVGISDSMKSRGYGLRGRTAFSIFAFDKRDALLSAAMLVCFGITAAAIALKQVYFRFYPSIKYNDWGAFPFIGCAAFMLLCLIPVLLNIKEALKWRAIRSKI